ncbi:DUF5615 family PIN-like protein [Nocardia sp. NPDC059764]|uniref:DUF5615 family PIN-like protein n=1 Tax=Nocardia sp. NPDC059764 TaxID=3346939 RepID=UPI003667BB46
MRNIGLSSSVRLRRAALLGCSAGLGVAVLVTPAQAQVSGAEEIGQKYEQFGGAGSLLGNPSGAVHEVAGGAVRDYAGGAIYYSQPTGAHVLYGDILTDYQRFGGPGGDLGFPTNDESMTPGDTGRFNDFSAPDGAAIYWTPRRSWVVRGPMLAAYRTLGGPAAELGFPAAAATVDADGTVTQKFTGDNGAAEISWNPQRGFATVPGGLAARLAGLSVPGVAGQLPGGTVNLPEGSVNLPDGKVRLPDGSIRLPDGSFQLPNGNMVLPDGSIKLSDGSITLPDGAVRLPDGSLRYTNGLIRMPDGAFTLPEGAVRLPDGTVQMADGSIVFPSGGVKLADGSFSLPGMSAPSTDKAEGWFTKFKNNLGWWWLLALLAIAAAIIGLLALPVWAWRKFRGSNGSGRSGATVGATRPVMDAKGAAADVRSGGVRMTGGGVEPRGGGLDVQGTAFRDEGAAVRAGDLGRKAGLAGAGAAAAGAAGISGLGRRARMTSSAPLVADPEMDSMLRGLGDGAVLDITYGEALQGLSPVVVGTKLLVDENLSPRLAERLEAAGYDVAHVRDVGLFGGDNRRALEQAKSSGRALVTAERTYIPELVVGTSVPSVVLLHSADATVDDQVTVLKQALPRLNQLLSGGALAVLSEQRIRAWRLPSSRG